jgi:hypothetical protein
MLMNPKSHYYYYCGLTYVLIQNAIWSIHNARTLIINDKKRKFRCCYNVIILKSLNQQTNFSKQFKPISILFMIV